jgi:hypothetical protein
MPQVGFEPMIPVFEWAKAVHALDRAATVSGLSSVYPKERNEDKIYLTTCNKRSTAAKSPDSSIDKEWQFFVPVNQDDKTRYGNYFAQ